MLDMIKERSAAGARFPEMNLQSMLSAHARQNSREGPGGPGTGVPGGGKMGASDSSLSPHSPAEHDRDEDLREAEMEEERGVREREHGHADSSGRDERHLSEEVRAQVFADLRRFSSRAVAAAAGIGGGATLTPAAPPVNSEPATSTTTSPPLPPQVSSAIPQPPERARSLEDSLPPRKRKVSQEHHNLAALSASEGFNGGIHDHNSRDSSGSSRDSKASPVKMAPHANTVGGDTDPSVPPSAPNADNDNKKGLEEDAASSRALECRN